MKYCVLCLQLKHEILRSVSTTETHEILRSVSTTETHEILRYVSATETHKNTAFCVYN